MPAFSRKEARGNIDYAKQIWIICFIYLQEQCKVSHVRVCSTLKNKNKFKVQLRPLGLGPHLGEELIYHHVRLGFTPMKGDKTEGGGNMCGDNSITVTDLSGAMFRSLLFALWVSPPSFAVSAAPRGSH